MRLDIRSQSNAASKRLLRKYEFRRSLLADSEKSDGRQSLYGGYESKLKLHLKRAEKISRKANRKYFVYPFANYLRLNLFLFLPGRKLTFKVSVKIMFKKIFVLVFLLIVSQAVWAQKNAKLVPAP